MEISNQHEKIVVGEFAEITVESAGDPERDWVDVSIFMDGEEYVLTLLRPEAAVLARLLTYPSTDLNNLSKGIREALDESE